VTISGVILAGGRSRRMGRDKALLSVDGRTLVEIVADRLREAGADPLLVVTKAPERLGHLARVGLRVVEDALPSGHPLAGAYTGLLHANGPSFVCACDMPFLNSALIRFLAELANGADAVVPRHGRGYEPLHAVYTPACLDAMRRCVARHDATTGFLADVRVHVVEEADVRRFDPHLASFENVNTPQEFEAALVRLRPS
jgi:molybdopterin-guanine dinucleotide biosynthesis protein A